MKIEDNARKGNKHINIDAVKSLPYHKLIAALVAKNTKMQNTAVLDIGCGMGQIEAELIKLNWPGSVVAADAYDVCIKATAKNANVSSCLKISESDFDILAQVGSQKFDCIIMSHVLEHLHNPSEKLMQVLSLLNPGGVAIVAVPNPSRPSVTINNIFQRHYANRGHVQVWDPSHWRVFLEDALKLDVVEYSHDFVPLPGCRKSPTIMRLSVAIAKIIPWWSFSNIATIRADRDFSVNTAEKQ